MLYKIRNFLFGSSLKRACVFKQKSYLNEKLDDILDWFSDKYTDLIIVPYETTCRFFYWGWKLKKNYSFDCSHNTYYMLHLKFKGLIDYSRKYAHLCWNSKEDGREFRRLKIACELAKRLWEDNYRTNTHKHDMKWGELKHTFGELNEINCRSFNLYRDKANTPELKEKEIKEFRTAMNADEQQKKNERKYLYKILEKHMEGWWD